MTLDLYTVGNFCYIDYEFPHLDHLNLGIENIISDNFVTITSFLQKNPKIDRIKDSGFYTLHTNRLISETACLTNVVDLKMNTLNLIGNEFIVRFIKIHKKIGE